MTPRHAQPQSAILVVGLALLLFGFMEGMRWLTQPLPMATSTGSVPASSLLPAPQEISVQAILQLPSPTPTAVPTRTPHPPTPTADPLGACGRPEPGGLCRIPTATAAPIPTVTPYPDCTVAMATPANAGGACRWATEG